MFLRPLSVVLEDMNNVHKLKLKNYTMHEKLLPSYILPKSGEFLSHFFFSKYRFVWVVG